MKLAPRKLPAKPVGPKKLAITRDTAPLTLAAPVDAGRGSVVPLGWVSVIDNKRILIGYTAPHGRAAMKAGARYTLDGGASWQAATAPVARNIDHGTSAGYDLDLEGTAAAVSSGYGCVGANPSPRQLMTKYTFANGAWKAHTPPVPIAADLRHCGSNGWVTRIKHGSKAGRLWATHGQIDRTHAMSSSVYFSDDDGDNWYPWGRGAKIPGSRESAWTTNTYCYQQPRVTEYKGHVACAWQDKRGLLWTYFDGAKWAKVMTIDKDAKATLQISALESFRVPGCIVTRGENEIFLTAWNVKGVLRWDGKKWHRENTKAEDAGKLTVCGDQVMLFTAGHVPEPPKRKQIHIRRKAEVVCWRRDKNAKWHGPYRLSPGGQTTIMYYRQMPGVIAPREAPANFVPVAWSDGQAIKMIRVPATVSKGL